MEPIQIHPPLTGEWRTLCPPGHHPFARDFVCMDVNRRYYHNSSRIRFLAGGIAADSFHCWNQPVHAPIDGEILYAGDGWDDNSRIDLWNTIRLWYNATYRFRPDPKDGRPDIRPNAGNHVMIRAKEGHIVFLAHLRNHSLSVAPGEHVKQGDLIGTVGNSGNSTMPHLHINLFDQMDDPFQAKVLPFVLTGFDALERDGHWVRRQNELPEAGEFVRLGIK